MKIILKKLENNNKVKTYIIKFELSSPEKNNSVLSVLFTSFSI